MNSKRAIGVAAVASADLPDPRVRVRRVDVLADDWGVLKRTFLDYQRGDGTWQEQRRETYDRGDGAVVLPYDPVGRTVVLVRQFRFPAWSVGHPGFLIEAPAGLLDEASPERRVAAEAEEETGFRLRTPRKVFELFMSPGSVTERLHCFVAEVEPGAGVGGGVAAEGEDIEVLELPFTEAEAMVANGEIADAKTVVLLQYARLHLFADPPTVDGFPMRPDGPSDDCSCPSRTARRTRRCWWHGGGELPPSPSARA
ncbi:NUDIX domain-containing protein [Phenylobacterium sp.]|jgi:nudix-type nucleoside diphosphatase (YffH/AdpP family)|uniref:NUDIX domain-containing protein n=1 Tax=Phenylobacterium sp. TaxID=1871053 RepID=UPI002E33B185|nr:GDP-mannose pyrophosphatase [Phenylobacterium sp.]HEX2562166.1 GDP-mannose pyrophosphatase [Phenylobacterium sp.]